jgi:hypothetical protein
MKFSIHTILVGNFLSVDEFIDNKNTDGFTDGKNVQKNCPLQHIGIFIGNCAI